MEANKRERYKQRTGDQGGIGRRKGGAGKRKMATPVMPNECENELMKDIGAPHYTWGDGSCWLWAVAGAMGKLEGTAGPTEKDIQLERTWRRIIRDTVLEHGLPMTEEEIDGLVDGVQYEQGRLTKGGTWGGGTEHQAMAVMLKTNIVIWHRRYVGKAENIIRGDEHTSIHLLYDHEERHYEYFSGVAVQPIETSSEPNETNRGVGQIGATARRMEEECSGKGAGRSTNIMGEEALGRRGGRLDELNGENQGEHLLEIHVGTLNVSEISYGYRGKYINTEEDLLKIRPGDKLREVTKMMKTQGISLLTLTDTHLGREGIREVGTYLRRNGRRGYARCTEKSRHLLYMEPSAKSVARARVRALDSGREVELYGIYMPVRRNEGWRAEAIWEKVMEDVTGAGNRNFVISGDFNAETEAWIKRSGRTQMKEDVVFQGVIEDLSLVTSITRDYTFERAKTQIDNILIPIELIHTLQTAHTATGVREKDHRLVVARFAWEVKGEKGGGRPTRRYTDKFEEEQWQQYEQILKERALEIKEALKDKRPKHRLMELQGAITRAAAEVAGRKGRHSD
eukprot:6213507-Pleurochrysis_carterae.AAC.2